MEYTPEFENQISDLEACALRLATTDEDTDEYVDAQRHFGAVLDDLVNTYPVDCDELTQHAESVARKYHNNPETTALKRIQILHAAFLAEVCGDFDPVY